jgi:Ca-activated chloride channel family protein
MMFRDPWWLCLLAAIPVIFWQYTRSNAGGTIKFSDIHTLKRIRPSLSLQYRHILMVLRCIAVALLAIALARPQKGKEDTRIVTEGVDIVLTVDTSGSMIAEDLERGKNRLDVVKKVIQEFIRKRKHDRIGLVVYGEDAYTQCPMTLDYGILMQFLDKCKIGMAGENLTAIGDALATSLLRLKDSKAQSRMIILLTDGVNNAGKIPPETAAEMARSLGIKVYTVGVGTEGMAPVPGRDFFGNRILQPVRVEIDTNLLANISNVSSGKFFRATDKSSLSKIYSDIDKMEKTKSETFSYMEWKELFTKFAVAGGVLLLLEVILAHTRFRKLP